uniref:protein asteroid homolog 1-like n=1 Tax=Styela clava TaxID=7725 RepID=UPI001939B877|nr:protein asteroid homolog 1-like [Styela clava]
MGIKGLSGFVHKYPKPLLEDINVSDTKVIIDGSELLYFLYFDCGHLDSRRGGDYTSFRSTIEQFVAVLNRCRIQPYVVFDSFKSRNNITRFLEEKTARLGGIRELVNSGNSRIQEKPLLGKDVLRQTLTELCVPFIVVPGDADAQIAAIANELDAMVLASDTDFCIFDVNKGFLFMSDFKWQEVTRPQRSCRGKIFRQSILEITFGTPRNALSVLGALMSTQDGILGGRFEDFLQVFPGEVRGPRNLRNAIECALVWLARYQSNDQIIPLFVANNPNFPEERFREYLRIYQQLPDIQTYVDTLLNGGESADVKPDCFEIVEGMQDPASFMPLMVDNPENSTSHVASFSIRQSLYELGCIIHFNREENDSVVERHIVEMDRIGQNYAANVMAVTVPNADQTEELHLEMTREELRACDTREVIMAAREKYLTEAMIQNADFSDAAVLGEENKLLVLSIYSWARCQEQAPLDEVCKALALTFSCSYNEIGGDSLPDAFRQIPKSSYDKVALHFSAQWQTIICEAMRLNNLLGCPIPNSKVGHLFSGTMFQKAHAFFLQNEDLANNDVADLLFYELEEPKQFFKKVLDVMIGGQ